MKTFTLVAAFAPVALAAFDNTCAYLSGGPSNEARTAVVDLVKRTWLPLDPGGSNGWSKSRSPTS
jgi:hypothetical protein